MFHPFSQKRGLTKLATFWMSAATFFLDDSTASHNTQWGRVAYGITSPREMALQTASVLQFDRFLTNQPDQ
jgi:hypothetical protein